MIMMNHVNDRQARRQQMQLEADRAARCQFAVYAIILETCQCNEVSKAISRVDVAKSAENRRVANWENNSLYPHCALKTDVPAAPAPPPLPPLPRRRRS